MNTYLFTLTGLTAAPGLAICIYIFWRDKFDREPLRLLAISFLLGMLSIFPALGLEYGLEALGISLERADNLWEVFRFTFFNIGFSEEVSKFLFLLLFAYPKKHFDEPYDGITYAVMIAMGFATLENIMYVYFSNNPMNTAMLRMFTAVPAHATFGIIMGYFMGLAKFSRTPVLFLLLSLLGAMLLHASYNFFLMQQSYPQIVGGAFVSLLLSIWLSLRAIRIHQLRSPFIHGPSEN